jgi:GGDEF domain-containing protein
MITTPESHPAANLDLQPTTIKEYIRSAKEIPPKSLDFIHTLFGEQIDIIADGRKNNATSILERMYSSALDMGLSREHEFNGETAPPVPMLSRQSMLYMVKQKAGFRHLNNGQEKFDVEKEFKALKFDLKDFRKADEINAGDFNLNLVAQALNEAVEEMQKTVGISQNDLVVGRYGGDEFCTFIIGDVPEHKIVQMQEIIKAHIENTHGYFEQGKPKRNFALKDGKVEVIDIPKDVDDKEIYLSFLDKNSLLNGQQIGVEKGYMRENQQTQHSNTRSSIYPPEIENYTDENERVIKKIEYLIKDHAELKVPYWYALLQDKKKGDINHTTVRKVLDFYQEYLIDPLLNEITLGRFDISDHLQKGNFSKMFVYEPKVKDINDHLSWTYADERVIKKLWEDNFRNKLRAEISTGNLVVGRIGASIILSQKAGSTLSEETLRILKEIKNIQSDYGGRRGTITHEVGCAEIDLTKSSTDEAYNKIFSEPTKDWLRKTFTRIFSDEAEYKIFCQLLQSEVDDQDHTLTTLSAWYFTGNRWEQRISGAQEILTEMSGTENMKSKISEIKEIFNRIKAKKILEEETN